MFDLSELRNNLLALPERIEQAVEQYGETAAARLVSEARKNRPWTDRTGQARQRLSGRCERTPGTLRIYLSHGVDYGTYLEFAHEKQYAVVFPTLRAEAPGVMQGLRGLIDRL